MRNGVCLAASVGCSECAPWEGDLHLDTYMTRRSSADGAGQRGTVRRSCSGEFPSVVSRTDHVGDTHTSGGRTYRKERNSLIRIPLMLRRSLTRANQQCLVASNARHQLTCYAVVQSNNEVVSVSWASRRCSKLKPARLGDRSRLTYYSLLANM
jgi:hypothetical protein